MALHSKIDSFVFLLVIFVCIFNCDPVHSIFVVSVLHFLWISERKKLKEFFIPK